MNSPITTSCENTTPPIGGLPLDHVGHLMQAVHVFTTRTEALAHMFLMPGAGFQWEGDGSLNNIYNPYPFKKIKDYRLEQDEELESLTKKITNTANPLLKELLEFERVRLQQEHHHQTHIMQNLKLYAKYHKGTLTWNDLNSGVLSAQGVLSEWVQLKVVHPEWAQAVKECALDIHMALSNLDEKKLSKTDQKRKSEWAELVELIDQKLQQTVGFGVYPDPNVLKYISTKLGMNKL